MREGRRIPTNSEGHQQEHADKSEGTAMGLGTEGRTHAERGESPSPAPGPAHTHEPSRLARLAANVGRVDGRTLVYVLLIIAACAVAIVAIAIVSQGLVVPPSAAGSLAGRH